MSDKQANECLFCDCRMCSDRVYTNDLSYDEVACRDHVVDLYSHANENISGLRNHASGSSTMRREKGSIENQSNASLMINLLVDCPKCKESFDALDSGVDEEHELLEALLSRKGWYGASGHDVTCPECEHEFVIGEVEW